MTWTVIVNQPGCLPDSPPDDGFFGWDSARDALARELEQTWETMVPEDGPVPIPGLTEALAKVRALKPNEAAVVALCGYVHCLTEETE